MREQITLSGSTNYNPSYPPANAKKGYVARITGRAGGAVKYQREFFGESVDLVHESLSLDRFRMPIVQAMLPFRMPRW